MNQFKTKLHRQMTIFTIFIIVICITLFTVFLHFYTTELNNEKMSMEADSIENKLNDGFADYRRHMLYVNTKGQFARFLLHRASMDETMKYHYEFQNSSVIKADLMITDEHQNILLSTIHDSMQEQELDKFNKQWKIDQMPEYTVRSSIFKKPNGYGKVVLRTPLYHDQELIGYVNYYWNMDSLHQLFNNLQFDYAMYDDDKNLLTISDPRLNQNDGVHWKESKINNTFYVDDIHYSTKDITVLNGLFHVCVIHTILANNHLLLMGMVFIILFGCIMIILFSLYAKRISSKASKSLSLLTKEMEELKNGNLNYKIDLKTQDEFEVIGEEINDMIDEIKDLTSVNAILHYESKLSELKFLEAQFDPHFLYNTLDTIRYAMVLDPKLANQLILNLTKILRYRINNQIENVTIEEDMEYIHMFLEIEKCRFMERFHYTIDLQESCMHVIVPRLLLQPLIENSIKNGFMNRSDLQVDIKGWIENDQMYLQVKDNGNGMDEETLLAMKEMLKEPENKTNHHGLYSVYRRLYLLYGNEDAMKIESKKNQGTCITLILHLRGLENV